MEDGRDSFGNKAFANIIIGRNPYELQYVVFVLELGGRVGRIPQHPGAEQLALSSQEGLQAHLYEPG